MFNRNYGKPGDIQTLQSIHSTIVQLHKENIELARKLEMLGQYHFINLGEPAAYGLRFESKSMPIGKVLDALIKHAGLKFEHTPETKEKFELVPEIAQAKRGRPRKA
jgi:hypothetical protein